MSMTVSMIIWWKSSTPKLTRPSNDSHDIPVRDNENRTTSLGSLSSGIQTDFGSESSINVENSEDVGNTNDEQEEKKGTWNRLRQWSFNLTYAFRRHVLRTISSRTSHRYESIKSNNRRNSSTTFDYDMEAQYLLESDDEDREGISNHGMEDNLLGITDQKFYSTEREAEEEIEDQIRCGITSITVYTESMQSSDTRDSNETDDQIPSGYTSITVYNDSVQSSGERDSNETTYNHSKNVLTPTEHADELPSCENEEEIYNGKSRPKSSVNVANKTILTDDLDKHDKINDAESSSGSTDNHYAKLNTSVENPQYTELFPPNMQVILHEMSDSAENILESSRVQIEIKSDTDSTNNDYDDDTSGYLKLH